MLIYLPFNIVKYSDKIKAKMSKEDQERNISVFRQRKIALAERQDYENYLLRMRSEKGVDNGELIDYYNEESKRVLENELQDQNKE